MASSSGRSLTRRVTRLARSLPRKKAGTAGCQTSPPAAQRLRETGNVAGTGGLEPLQQACTGNRGRLLEVVEGRTGALPVSGKELKSQLSSIHLFLFCQVGGGWGWDMACVLVPGGRPARRWLLQQACRVPRVRREAAVIWRCWCRCEGFKAYHAIWTMKNSFEVSQQHAAGEAACPG